MYWKGQKTVFLFSIISLFYCFTAQFDLCAANLHAILVCDTDASSIGPSVELDYANMVRCVKTIASQTGLTPKIVSFREKKAQANFMEKVKKLKVGSSDVVIFYWSGHGFHSEMQEDIWPILDFTYGETLLSQYDITLQLMKKKPRLFLSMADCCNNYLGDRAWKVIKGPKSKASKENYKKLFLKGKGVYIASGCLVGEYSFGLNDDFLGIPGGGFFTNAWLSALYSAVAGSDSDLSWEKVFDGAIQQTIDYQLSDEDDPTIYQTPQYEKLRN